MVFKETFGRVGECKNPYLEPYRINQSIIQILENRHLKSISSIRDNQNIMYFKEETPLNKAAIVTFWFIVSIFAAPIILALGAIIGIIVLVVLATIFVIGLAFLPFALVWYFLK